MARRQVEPPRPPLLLDVRRPAGHTRSRERRGEELPRDPDRLEEHGRIELDVGPQRAVRVAGGEERRRFPFDGARELQARGDPPLARAPRSVGRHRERRRAPALPDRFSQPPERALQDGGARIPRPVDAMPHAHDPPARVQLGVDPLARLRSASDGVEHVEDGPGRATMQRSLQRAEGGGDGRHEIGAGRGHHSRGKGGRVEAMIDDRDEVRVESAHLARGGRATPQRPQVVRGVRERRIGRHGLCGLAPPDPRGREDRDGAGDESGPGPASSRRRGRRFAELRHGAAQRVHGIRRVERAADRWEHRVRRLAGSTQRFAHGIAVDRGPVAAPQAGGHVLEGDALRREVFDVRAGDDQTACSAVDMAQPRLRDDDSFETRDHLRMGARHVPTSTFLLVPAAEHGRNLGSWIRPINVDSTINLPSRSPRARRRVSSA